MSASDCYATLSATYDRALRSCAPHERAGVRRAFRRALRAASAGDARPTILLAYRWP